MPIYQRQIIQKPAPRHWTQDFPTIMESVGKIADIPNQQRIKAREELEHMTKQMGMPVRQILRYKQGRKTYARAIGISPSMLDEMLKGTGLAEGMEGEIPSRVPTPAMVTGTGVPKALASKGLTMQQYAGLASQQGIRDIFSPERAKPDMIQITTALGAAMGKPGLVGETLPREVVQEFIKLKKTSFLYAHKDKTELRLELDSVRKHLAKLESELGSPTAMIMAKEFDPNKINQLYEYRERAAILAEQLGETTGVGMEGKKPANERGTSVIEKTTEPISSKGVGLTKEQWESKVNQLMETEYYKKIDDKNKRRIAAESMLSSRGFFVTR